MDTYAASHIFDATRETRAVTGSSEARKTPCCPGLIFLSQLQLKPLVPFLMLSFCSLTLHTSITHSFSRVPAEQYYLCISASNVMWFFPLSFKFVVSFLAVLELIVRTLKIKWKYKYQFLAMSSTIVRPGPFPGIKWDNVSFVTLWL